MKGFGGSKRANLHGMVTVQQVVDYALSYPAVTTQCIGIDSPMAFAQQAVAAALNAKPMSVEERNKFLALIQARGGAEYAAFLKEGYNDGGVLLASRGSRSWRIASLVCARSSSLQLRSRA